MTHHTKSESHHLVGADEQLHDILDDARREGLLALDTEFMRERTYRARLCLIQVATHDRICLVDPLKPLDLAAIAEVVGDPAVEILVHAGKQDLDIFFERFGVVPSNIFDVQVAAAFAGYGASLPYGRLVDVVIGVSLEKGESYTDWCRRPLTEAQLRYAADDVRYLHVAAEKLRARLEELDRTAWLAEEMEAYSKRETYENDPGEAWRRVTGRGNLNPKQTAVLREVARWREEEAARRDLPRGWIVKDPTLIELARRAPSSASALHTIRGLNAKEVERCGDALLEAIRAGRRAEPLAGAPAPPRSIQVRARMVAGIADAVARARCENASIAMEVVATRADLESLLVDAFRGTLDASHRLFHGWRRELVGDAIVGIARGELAVRVTDSPPFVEEIAVENMHA